MSCSERLNQVNLSNVDSATYEEVATNLLILATIGNSRRGGEVSKMTVKRAQVGLDKKMVASKECY